MLLPPLLPLSTPFTVVSPACRGAAETHDDAPLEPLSRSLASASVSLFDQFGCRTGGGRSGARRLVADDPHRCLPHPLPACMSHGAGEIEEPSPSRSPFFLPFRDRAFGPLKFYFYYIFFLFPFSFVLDNYFVTSSLIRAYPLEPLSAWLTLVRTFGRSGFALSFLPLMVKKLQQLKILEHMVLAVCKYVYMYCPIIILNSSKLRIIHLNKNST